LAEYKKDVKKKLTDAAKQRAESETDSSIFQKVVEGCEVEIPEPMITRETDYMINDMAQRMSYQGINLDDYMKITNTTMDMLREQYKSEAENRVKSQLVFEAIQKAEGLEVTDEDVDAELQEVAGDKSIEEVKKTLNESNINYLKEVALTKKTTKFLKDNAEIKAKQAKKKAPAKKAASDKKEAPAKKTTKKAEAKDEK
jgi:trigger factor